jgi:hypothetical protein
MSCCAKREVPGSKKVCQRCNDRRARFRYRGSVRADRDHTLCFECYRSERDRQRSRAMASVSRPILRVTSPVTASTYSVGNKESA